MGGITSKKCDKLVKEFQLWSIKSIWGCDSLSCDDQTEWIVYKPVFNKIVIKWEQPKTLLTIWLNKQIDRYCSWHLDPDATYVSAFGFPWENIGYFNPPFSLIGRVVRKICQDQAKCTLVAPVWLTQPWFNHVLKKLVDHPVNFTCDRLSFDTFRHGCTPSSEGLVKC